MKVPAEVEFRSYAKSEMIPTLGGKAEAKACIYFGAIASCVVSWATCTGLLHSF